MMQQEQAAPLAQSGNGRAGGKDGTGADLVKGAVAGVVATNALVRTRNAMYDRLDEETLAREEAARGDSQVSPMQKPVRGVAHTLHVPLEKRNEERLGNALAWGLGISGVMGYAFARKRVKALRAGKGLVFGAAAWLLEDELMMRALGLVPPLTSYPFSAHWRGFVSHLAYGTAAETTLQALDRVA